MKLPPVPNECDRSPQAGPAYFDYSDMDSYGGGGYGIGRRQSVAILASALGEKTWKILAAAFFLAALIFFYGVGTTSG